MKALVKFILECCLEQIGDTHIKWLTDVTGQSLEF
jgi:hypothetical protein